MVLIAGCNLPVVSLGVELSRCSFPKWGDLYSRYDQLELDKKYRDKTAIMMPLGLLRQTTVLQGATNSASQFMRVVTKILEEHIPHIALPFMDDIVVKGPRDRYKDEEMPGLSGVRRFITHQAGEFESYLLL
jgi:hypothetical protein